jgi:DNA replication ATP-dependent helicase Dna2
VIIDEASQILEPMLIGLLQKFKRFILIGDHKQLPAVVTQAKSDSIIKHTDLREIGITDMRMSLFERLYYQCKDNNWFHAFDIISFQGRMHTEIMNFVSNHFYENKLKSLEKVNRLHKHLNLIYKNDVQKVLASKRMIFIDTKVDKSFNVKTNYHEAKAVNIIIQQLTELYDINQKTFTEESVGVITPYRAQISLIKQDIHMDLKITVDTVERYQGGARDIVILSLCTNRLSQMNTLVSESNEGIDRKLNVALTRAKEQIIIIGNRQILDSNFTYKRLIESCFSLSI